MHARISTTYLFQITRSLTTSFPLSSSASTTCSSSKYRARTSRESIEFKSDPDYHIDLCELNGN